jgi:hypothetical protein
MINLVLITSVINVSSEPYPSAPYFYNFNTDSTLPPTRSIYSINERVEQTLNTINSIKTHIPESYIVLLEGSKCSEALQQLFKNNTDEYYDSSQFENVYTAVNSINKGLGEIQLLLSYLQSNSYKLLRKITKTITKISGRYVLLDSFKYYDNISHIICKNIYNNNTSQMITYYYQLPYTYIDSFIDFLINLSTDQLFCNCNNPISIEKKLYTWVLSKNYLNIETIGITGTISQCGTLISM